MQLPHLSGPSAGRAAQPVDIIDIIDIVDIIDAIDVSPGTGTAGAHQ